MIEYLFLTEQGRQRFSGLQELGGRDSIVVGSVNRDVRERLLDSIKPSGHVD